MSEKKQIKQKEENQLIYKSNSKSNSYTNSYTNSKFNHNFNFSKIDYLNNNNNKLNSNSNLKFANSLKNKIKKNNKNLEFNKISFKNINDNDNINDNNLKLNNDNLTILDIKIETSNIYKGNFNIKKLILFYLKLFYFQMIVIIIKIFT